MYLKDKVTLYLGSILISILERLLLIFYKSTHYFQLIVLVAITIQLYK